MPGLKEIKARIDATSNTQKITSAMKLVSAAKLRQAQYNIVNMRPYAQKIMAVICDIAITQKIDHPLLSISTSKESANGINLSNLSNLSNLAKLDKASKDAPEVAVDIKTTENQQLPKKVLFVVLSSDRGLCGSFNANIIKFAQQYYEQNVSKYESFDFLFIGRRAADFFKNKHVKVVDIITGLDRSISYGLASQISDRLVNFFIDGDYNEIRLVYNEFKSAIDQRVVCERLLPLDVQNHSNFELKKEGDDFSKDFIFEPAPHLLIDQLVMKHLSIQVYRCLSESVAAEHGARMTSMESATKNAGELIRNMTLTYNKLRQTSITTELIEITSGAEALKG